MFVSHLSSMRVKCWKLLPLLFIFAFSFIGLTPKDTYAGTGYLTGNLEDFDGFLNGNPFYTNSWPQFTVYGNKNSYNGYSGNLPSLCMKQGASTTTSCNSNFTQGGTNYNTWLSPLLSTPLESGFDLKGIERLYTSSTEVPNAWKGQRVMLTLALNFSDMSTDGTTGELSFVRKPNAAKLNWGAVTFVNRGSSNTCNDQVQFRFITTDNSTDDFVTFELDYTNVTKDTVCNIYPEWEYGGNDSHGYLYYGDFAASENIVVHNPYIGWDIVTDQNTDDIGTIIDDWKEQQGEEFDKELEIIQGNSDDASNAANALNLSFSVINVFSGWFGLFTANECVNIPTLANMIHVTNSQVCSPWPSNVRSVLSPVFAIFGTVVLSFFIYRWLMNREGKEIE